MAHLLIVEDDDLLRDGLAAQLGQAGHQVTTSANGALAQELLESTRFDGVVLDLGLPLLDGMQLLRWIRKRLLALPVLILTARDGVEDRVEGLNAGADDYLTKPFEFEELLARLRALLRRSDMTRPPVLVADDLRLDPASLQVTRAGRPVELTPKEFALLQALAIDNLIDAHMSKLRRKIDAAGARPLIETVRGRGFRLRGPDDA